MAKEADLYSPDFTQIKTVPAALGSEGEVLKFNSLTGALVGDISAAQVALGEERSLIAEGNIVQVIKVAGQVWVAGQPIYWDPAATGFTNVRGILRCVGYVYEAALNAAITGAIVLMGVPQAGNGLLMQSGMATVTGTLASIDTGLTLIITAFANTMIAAQGAGTSGYVTYDHGADGLLDLYCWDDAGAAATVAAEISWLAFGS